MAIAPRPVNPNHPTKAMLIKEAIALAAKYVSKRPSHPVLACIKSTGNTLEAFDLETAISIKIAPTPVFCVNGEMLKKFTAKLDKFSLTATDDAIQIAGTGSNAIATIDPDQFPCLPEVKGKSFTIWESKFFKAWQTVKPAIKTNHTRRMFQGANLKIRDNVATLSGTDGHKAASASFKVTAPNCDITIPIKFFEILKTKSDRELMITHDAFNISMAIGDIVITSKLLEGNYPELPKASGEVAVLDREYRAALLSNLEIAKAMGSDTIDLYIRGQELILKCFTTDSKTERYEINTPTPTHLYYYALAIATPITQYVSYHQAIAPSSWFRKGYGYQHSEGREAHLSFSLSYEFIANTLKFVLPIAAQADQQARIGIDNLIKVIKTADKDRDLTIAIDSIQDQPVITIGSLGKNNNNASIMTCSKEPPAPYGEVLEFKAKEDRRTA